MTIDPHRLALQSARLNLHAPSGMRLDETDLKILRLLCEGETGSIQAIAERIHLTRTGTRHRIRRLEEAGAVLRYNAELDDTMFGAAPYYRIDITLTPAGRLNRASFDAAIRKTPEIVESDEMVGKYDLSVKAALAQPADWDRIQKNLDPAFDCIEAFKLRPLKRAIKRPSPHPLLLAEDEDAD